MGGAGGRIPRAGMIYGLPPISNSEYKDFRV